MGAREIPPGTQTYPFRNEFAKDIPGTLKALAGIGTRRIELCSPWSYGEFAGFKDYKPADLKKLLSSHNIVAESCHYGMSEFKSNLDERIAWAKELGMTSTVFHSVHGLPPATGQEHDVTTARDLALLCRELLKHPDALRYTSTRQRPFRPNVPGKTIDMRTHNALLGHVEGCDGLKTGWIAPSGYSIAVTAARRGQRVIAVVLDSIGLKVRDAKAAELVAKGFAALPAASQAAAAPLKGQNR